MFISALVVLASAAWGLEEPPDALELLRESSQPPAVAYAGEVSVITWHAGKTKARELLVEFSPPARYRRELVDRWGYTHQLIVSDGKTEWFYDRARRKAYRGVPADPDYKVLGPEEEFELLAENYAVRLAGSETVAGRPCWVVELARRTGGSPVRTVWIDRRTKLVLQSKSFHPDGSIASTMRFLKVELPARPGPERFSFSPPVGAETAEAPFKPDYLELEDAREASGMPPRRPGWLPPGYVFESLSVLPHRGSTFLHYRYSDGVDALSLFQGPEGSRLDFGALPRESVRLGKGRAELAFGPDGKILEWPGRGQRFILVGSLPLEALKKVAESVE